MIEQHVAYMADGTVCRIPKGEGGFSFSLRMRAAGTPVLRTGIVVSEDGSVPNPRVFPTREEDAQAEAIDERIHEALAIAYPNR